MAASDQSSPQRRSANSTSTSPPPAAATARGAGNQPRNGGRVNGIAIVVASSLLCHVLFTGTYQKVLPPNVSQSVDKVVLKSKEQLNQAMSAVARLFASVGGGDESDAGGASQPFETEVPELQNDAELQAALSKHSRVFLMAYAPWCGHCKAMKPAYVELKNLVNEEFSEDKIRVYRYNAVKDKCENCRIDSLNSTIAGFPTLLMIHPGPVLEKYESGRDAKSMMTFIKDSFLPPQLAETADEVKAHLKKHQVALINYFQKPAMNLDDAVKKTLGVSKSTILFVDNKDLIKDVSCGDVDLSKSQVLVFKNGECKGAFPEYAAGESAKPEPTIIANMLASDSVGFFSDREFMTQKLPQVFILVRFGQVCDNLSSEQCKAAGQGEYLATFKKVFKAPELFGRAVGLILDPKQDKDNSIASIVGINTSSVNCYMVFDTSKNSRYGICDESAATGGETPISSDDLAAYFKSAMAGSIDETVNSNLLKTASKQVTTLSRFDVNKFVSYHKNILLYSYTVQKQGKQDSDKLRTLTIPDYVIAEIDLTIDQKFEIGGKEFSINDSPQVILIRDGKFVKEYKGEISQEKLANFVAQNSVKTE